MLRRWLSPILLVTVAAVVLAACGGPTQASVIARGNAICSRSVAAIRALGLSTGAVQRAAAIVGSETLSLQKLPRPAAHRALLSAFLRAQSELSGEYAALAAAEQRRDRAAASRAQAALATNPAPTLARRYGLSRCAAPGATVGS